MSNKKASVGKKKSFLVVLLVILLIITASAAGYFAWQLYQSGEGKEAVVTKRTVQVKPIFVNLDPFTVSIISSEQDDFDRVLYVGITINVKDEQSAQLIKDYLPEIRSHLLQLFSTQTVDNLMTSQGKKELLDSIKQYLQQSFVGDRAINVNNVLYNTFIIR